MCLGRVIQDLNCPIDTFTRGSNTPTPQALQMDDDDRTSVVPGALWNSDLRSSGSGLRHPLQKRQRSPSGALTLRASSVSQMKRPQRSITSTYFLAHVRSSQDKEAVRAMLKDLSKGSTPQESCDTSDLALFICEDAKRLGIAKFIVTEDSGYISLCTLQLRSARGR